MAKEEVKDTGLGLSEFLATQEKEVIETTPVAEAKPEETPKVQTEEKPTETTEKPEEKPAEEVKTEVKTEEKPEEKAEVKPTIDWESEENPFKKRHQDSSNWANKVNMENVELKKRQVITDRQLEVINKKLDGTYDADAEALVDAKANEVNPKEIADNAGMAGRIVASRDAAYQMYGKDNVENTLWADNAPFRAIESDPIVEARIKSSMSPVLEAMKCVEEYAFYAKWGNKPKDIEENIKKAYEKEIEDRVTKKILEKVNLKEKQVTGIGEARGAPGATPPDKNAMPPLKEVFGGR